MSIQLSKRAIRVLSELLSEREITPRAVARFTLREVLLQSGCGRITATEIERWLGEHDLKFRVPRDQFDPVRQSIANASYNAARRRRKYGSAALSAVRER